MARGGWRWAGAGPQGAAARARTTTAALLLACGAAGAWAQAQVLQAAPGGAAQAMPAVPDPSGSCRPDPLAGRALHLRGSFGNWAADDAMRLAWACDRWQLVARLEGEHRFKIGDEGWSADADFGAPDGSAAAGDGAGATTTATLPLAPRGGDLRRRFAGLHRFTLQPGAAGAPPELTIEACPHPPPLGERRLYLRGTMTDWAAREDAAFVYSCDAYYLTTELKGEQRFRIADESQPPDAMLEERGRPFERVFDGRYTLRVAREDGRLALSFGPPRFPDPRSAAVSDPVALGLRYDSRDLRHKSPFGAVKAGTEVRFAVQAPLGVEALTLVVESRRLEGDQEVLAYTEQARVPMQRSALAAPDGGGEAFSARHRFDAVGVHGYWFEARIGGRRYALQNNATPLPWTREKGIGGAGAVSELAAGATPEAAAQALASIRRYRLSVYRPDFQVPAWAQGAIYYYLFPERFRNGDPRNDPQVGQRRYQNHPIERHPRWMSTPYLPGSGDGSDAVYTNDFFGGDLEGIRQKLDHLRRLGITVIYSTPLLHGASNHKYDAADFHRIDPAFGTNAEFTRLTREAARRGIRIMVDTSLNHVGADSIYFDRYGNFRGPDGRSLGAFTGSRVQPDSPYLRWFQFRPGEADPDRQYRAWVGVKDLPELDKNDPGWRDFAYRAPDSVTRRWLKAGAEGWRMDVAPWVPDDFWREWRSAVKATKPQAATIAETWWDPAKHLLGDMFDGSMNYIFRSAALDYANGGKAAELAARLEHLREQIPPPAHAAMMNLISSHDRARALWEFGDRGEATPAAERQRARQRWWLAFALMMAQDGSPSIYYGDEVGMTGGDDPFNRGPYPWEDAGGQPDRTMEREVAALVALRRAEPVIGHGRPQAPLWVDDAVLVQWRAALPGTVRRPTAARHFISAVNNAPQARTLSVPLPAELQPARWRLAWSTDDRAPGTGRPRAAAPIVADAQGRLAITVPAGGAVWLLAN